MLTNSAPVAVAHAKLQRHDEIHQPDHERHRHEKDHDRAMGGEDLVVVLGRQVALRLERDRLLRSHHERVDETAQKHHRGERHIHDADMLVVDAGDPFTPQIRDPALDRDEGEHAQDHHDDEGAREQGNWLVERNRAPAQLAQHRHFLIRAPAPGLVSAIGPGPGGNV
jgi:hypothetical protein